MSEDTGADTSGEGESTTPTLAINEDGTFSADWHKQIADGAYADNGTLSNFKTLEGLAKTVINQQTMIGADKVVKLSDSSSDADIEAYYRGAGHPEDVSGYKLNAMEMADDSGYNTESEAGIIEWAHKNRLNSEQTTNLLNEKRQGHLDSEQASVEANNKQIADAQVVLDQKWGADKDRNIKMAGEMMGNPNVERLVNELGLGNNPSIIELLYELRLGTKEDSMPQDTTFGADQVSAEQALEQILIEKSGLITSTAPDAKAKMNALTKKELAIRNRLGGDKLAKGAQSTAQFRV